MNKIRTIEGKISKLESRKHDLEAELTELETGMNEVTDRLGAAILEGGNTSKIEGDLTAMTTRQSGLVAAIGKADSDLGGLRSELDIEQTKATRAEITGTIARVKSEMAAAADQVMILSDDSARWDQELRAAADRAQSMHLLEEHGAADHLKQLWSFSMLQLQNVAADLKTRRSFVNISPLDELRDPTLKAEFRK